MVFDIVLTGISQISQKEQTPKGLSFGWQRAQLLGAFFNGVFLLVSHILITNSH